MCPCPVTAHCLQGAHDAPPWGQHSTAPNHSVRCSESKRERLFHDQVVAASIPGLKSVLISAVKTWSNSCSITAHSATLQKQKKCLITISTSHVLGVKSLEVTEWKGKETENSLVQSDLETAIQWRGGKGLSKQDAFRLEWSSHCEARNSM